MKASILNTNNLSMRHMGTILHSIPRDQSMARSIDLRLLMMKLNQTIHSMKTLRETMSEEGRSWSNLSKRSRLRDLLWLNWKASKVKMRFWKCTPHRILRPKQVKSKFWNHTEALSSLSSIKALNGSSLGSQQIKTANKNTTKMESTTRFNTIFQALKMNSQKKKLMENKSSILQSKTIVTKMLE